MQHKSVLINELSSLKLNKSLEYDEINFNVVRKCFGELFKPLKHVLNLSIESGVLPDKLKISRASPVHKAGDNSDLTNYRSIPVLPYFSKFLERLMYNSPLSYVSQEKSYIQNNSVFNLVIQQSVLFCN